MHHAALVQQQQQVVDGALSDDAFVEAVLAQPSALNETLLVVLLPQVQHMAMLDAAYRRHFWDVLYVAPQASNQEIRELSAKGYAVAPCSAYMPLGTAKTRLGLEHRFDA